MNKILIIQTAFIGDVVLATPIIEKLDQHFPEANIDFIVRKGNEALLLDHPKINNTLIWDKSQNKYKNLFALLNSIRKEKYDVVINLQRYFASGFLTAFSNSSLKIGFTKNPFSFLFHKKFGHTIRGLHETNRNLSLIQDLTDKKYIGPKLYPRKSDYTNIESYVKQAYVCIAPTSVWKTKELPQVKWIELMLSFNENLTVYLLGAPSDFAVCEELKNHTERKSVINLAGKLELLSSAALMESALMNYVNDSAPMHIASAMNAPCNAVFCSTQPSFGFGPLSMNSKVIETTEDLNCRPCGLHGKKECPLGHFNCGHSISIKQFDKPEI